MALYSNLYPNTKGVQGIQGIQGTLNSIQGTRGLQGPQGISVNGFVVTNVTSPYILQSSDVGKLISINSGFSPVTIPSNRFSFGNSFMIYNGTTSTQTLIEGSNINLYSGDGSEYTGNKDLPPNSITTVLCSASNEFICSGSYISNLVTNGLKINLDASNPVSYFGSARWKDISGNGNDAFLKEGASFTNTSSGGIVFNGSTSYVDVTDITPSVLSINVGFRINSDINVISGPSNPLYQYIIFRKNPRETEFSAYHIAYNEQNDRIEAVCNDGNGVQYLVKTLDNSIVLGKDYIISLVLSSDTMELYLNGILVDSSTKSSFISYDDNHSIKIGRLVPNISEAYDMPLNGNVYFMQLYDRALTAQEVKQNFEIFNQRLNK